MRTPPISLVLRLLPEPAAAGLLVGRVEVVDTGEIVTVRNAAELSALARRLSGEAASESEDHADGPGIEAG